MGLRPSSPLAIALLGFALAGGPGGAQEAGDAGIPDPGAPEGAVLTAHLDRPFDRYALPVARFGPDSADSLRPVEGRVIWSAFRLEDAGASAAGVMAAYRVRLGELGFVPLLDCAGPDCGGFDFRFGVELLPPPAMLIDTAELAQLSAVQTGPEGAESFASVLVSRVLGGVYVQTVLVLPAATERVLVPTSRAEVAATARLQAADGHGLWTQLAEHGHVTLHGLEFETGGATLSAGSEPALDAVAGLLSAHPESGILIVGHSDNEGALDANIALSKRRAEAVRAALVARGVEPGRLEAHGVGYLAPVASNATPEGMAVNRRVELVLR